MYKKSRKNKSLDDSSCHRAFASWLKYERSVGKAPNNPITLHY